MTAEQITKALEEFINYQKQEIEELKAEVSTAKLEAVKEFTGKAKSKLGDLEYNSRTNRKTIPIEKHDEIVDWILHEVVLNMVSELEKETKAWEESHPEMLEQEE